MIMRFIDQRFFPLFLHIIHEIIFFFIFVGIEKCFHAIIIHSFAALALSFSAKKRKKMATNRVKAQKLQINFTLNNNFVAKCERKKNQKKKRKENNEM